MFDVADECATAHLPGIVACISDLLADFVGHMERNGYLEDTVVVITGDHLSMPNAVQETMDLEPQRTIYNKFWSPLEAKPNRSELYNVFWDIDKNRAS